MRIIARLFLMKFLRLLISLAPSQPVLQEAPAQISLEAQRSCAAS
jgi:hypothetical protein